MEHEPDQNLLWQQVQAIKQRVGEALGAALSHDFRSQAVYQAYTGLLGECQMAYEDQQLDRRYLDQLERYAESVLALRRQRPGL